MSDNLLMSQDDNLIIELGQAANRVAAQHTIQDYRERKSLNTLRAQDADLLLFAEFIKSTGITDKFTFTEPTAWRGISWGLVKGFVQWLLTQDYSIGSVNRTLATVKVYARLAFQSGSVEEKEYLMIKGVQGYSPKESKRINERRTATRKVRTVNGTTKPYKKPEAILISRDQAKQLKEHPDTPQGRRDAVLMHLLLDHGLRAGEVALLTIGNVNLGEKTLTFYRPKVDKLQTLELTSGTWRTLKAWMNAGDAPLAADAPLLRGSRKGGSLTEPGMSERAITDRVRVLAEERIGVQGYSAHDTRHYWATYFYKKCKDPMRLQEAGGWNSLAMPRRYVEWATIANEGVGDLD